MNDAITLYRLRDAQEARMSPGQGWLAFLASRLPRRYALREFDGAAAPSQLAPGSAIHCRIQGDLMGRVAWALAQPGVAAWMAAGAPLVFDQSAEPGPATVAKWRAVRELIEQNVAQGRIIWLQQNERGPAMCREAFGGLGAVRVDPIVFHYWLHRTRMETQEAPVLRDAPRQARYLALNRRLRPHRAALLGWLRREGVFAQGLISAPRLEPGETKLTWPTMAAFVAAACEQFPGFREEIEGCTDLLATGRTLEEGAPLAHVVPWELHARTGFSLISETEMRDGRLQRFTEKTLKPLGGRHPFLVAGNPGTLALLRAYGFRTFSPWIDESYDLVEAPEERLRSVLAEAKRLIVMPEDAFDALREALDPVVEHNARHFMDGLPAIMERQHAALSDAILAAARTREVG